MPDPVTAAAGYLGAPYQFGGNSAQGIDCSGLVHQAYPHLPRTAREQFQATQRVSTPRPGDLVFLQGTQAGLGPGQASHVGIYDGANVIAASSTAGHVVRQPLSMWTSGRNFLGFGRPGGSTMSGSMPQMSPRRPGTLPGWATPGVSPQDPSLLLGHVPPPPAPPVLNYVPIQADYRALGQATVTPAQQQLPAAQAQQAGAQAALGAYQNAGVTAPDPAQYAWKPVDLGAFPERQMPAIPDRPAPTPNGWAQGLAALAGIFDPQHAGAFNAVPLDTSVALANQQFGDRQEAYRQAVQQADLAQRDAEAARADQFRQLVLNQQEPFARNEALNRDRLEVGNALARPTAEAAAGGALVNGLTGLMPAEANEARLRAALQADLLGPEGQLKNYELGSAYNKDLFGRAAEATDQATKAQEAAARLQETSAYHAGVLDNAAERNRLAGVRNAQSYELGKGRLGVAQDKAAIAGTSALSRAEMQDVGVKTAMDVLQKAVSHRNVLEQTYQNAMDMGKVTDVASGRAALDAADRDIANATAALQAEDQRFRAAHPVPSVLGGHRPVATPGGYGSAPPGAGATGPGKPTKPGKSSGLRVTSGAPPGLPAYISNIRIGP